MKKIIFSALLATVAIGGALSAQTTQAPAFAQLSGVCATATVVGSGCNITNTGTQCSAITAGLADSGPAFTTRNSPALCSIPLKRP